MIFNCLSQDNKTSYYLKTYEKDGKVIFENNGGQVDYPDVETYLEEYKFTEEDHKEIEHILEHGTYSDEKKNS